MAGRRRQPVAAPVLDRLLRDAQPAPSRDADTRAMPTDTAPVGLVAGAPPLPRPRPPVALLLGSLLTVAVFTLTPAGSGWSWGDPAEELRWYVTGLGRTGATVQLMGNLVLLAPTAALAVLRWPGLGRRAHRLPVAALATAAAVELLQWVLPLGRVVSPLDALLNATGAVVVGGVVAWTAARLR